MMTYIFHSIAATGFLQILKYVKYKKPPLNSPPPVGSRLIPWRTRTYGTSSVILLISLLSRAPLLFRILRTREGESEGSPQGLRGRVGEVEQWAC